MQSKNTVVSKILKYRVMLLMLAPAVIYFFLFSYIPMAGIIIAFKRFTYSGGIFGSPWAGFDNFRFFFLSGDAFNVTKNTVLFNIVFITMNTVIQILSAIILSEISGKWFKKIAQSMMFLPYFISWVVVGAFVYNIFNFEFGSFNSLLKSLGVAPVDVYGNVGVWKYIIVFFKVWKEVGYGSVLYLASIMSIDQEMYEAADIDGANVFQKITRITLPSLIPTVVVLILLAIGNIFRGDFAMFYNVVGNNARAFSSTDVIDTYVFRSLTQLQEFGMAAASGLYQSVLCFAIIMSVNYCVKKYNSDYALF